MGRSCAVLELGMKVLLRRPARLRVRLDILSAGIRVGDVRGWWRVLLFGRTGVLETSRVLYDWHQDDVFLAPGMTPAMFSARVANLLRAGWSVRYKLDGMVFRIRARRERCRACDIGQALRAQLRRAACPACSNRGWVGAPSAARQGDIAVVLGGAGRKL